MTSSTMENNRDVIVDATRGATIEGGTGGSSMISLPELEIGETYTLTA